jgi:hypothetical protein
MSTSIKLVDKLEGVENFHAWKYRIGLILEENDLARFVKEELPEPEDAAEKAKHQKDTIRAKRIIADSIKDHLIPYVSSKKTPKRVSAVEVIDPCMPGDKFDELLPSLIQLINPSTFSMLDNIMHQKVQGVNQTPRPKDV